MNIHNTLEITFKTHILTQGQLTFINILKHIERQANEMRIYFNVSKCTRLYVRMLEYNYAHIINTHVKTGLGALYAFMERYQHSNFGSKLLSILE